MKRFPDQNNGETVEQYVERTWKGSAEIQAEFSGDISRYEAYCKAMAAGRVRVFSSDRRMQMVDGEENSSLCSTSYQPTGEAMRKIRDAEIARHKAANRI